MRKFFFLLFLIWQIFSLHVFKQDVPVQLDGEEVSAMVYIMNLKMGFGLPSPYYYQTVLEGYHDCGLGAYALEEAVKDSAQKFYREYGERSQQQTLFDTNDYYDGYSEEEPEEADEPEMDETDPFYFSEGMHL